MKRYAVRILLLLGLVALGWYLKNTVLTPDPVEVEVFAAEKGRVEETVTNSRAGTVEARRRAGLSPEIGGTVVELPFREGRRVERGDVLLRLDDSLQRARLEVAKRELDAATAERRRACLVAERAERELARGRGLVEDGIVSADRLDQLESAALTSQAACGAAEATEARARSGVALAEAELAKTVIRAPFAGIVADLRIEVGEYSTPSPPAVPVPPVIDLLDPSSIYISAPMDEVDSARIANGLPARVTVDSHRGRELAGRVVRIAPYVLDFEEQNRTVEIEAELEDEAFAATLLPGTSADVEVVIASRDDVLRVPSASLVEGRRVLILENGRLRGAEVEAGLSNWDFTEVREGLAEGARVVVSLDRLEVQAGAEAVAAPSDGGGDGAR